MTDFHLAAGDAIAGMIFGGCELNPATQIQHHIGAGFQTCATEVTKINRQLGTSKRQLRKLSNFITTQKQGENIDSHSILRIRREDKKENLRNPAKAGLFAFRETQVACYHFAFAGFGLKPSGKR